MRIYTRLYEPCHAGRSGRLERERRAADERTGRNGSARISSRPEDLTTERRTIQRELQQVRPSTRCRKSRRPRERAGEVQKRPAKKSKIARELKKGIPTGSIFHRPTTGTPGAVQAEVRKNLRSSKETSQDFLTCWHVSAFLSIFLHTNTPPAAVPEVICSPSKIHADFWVHFFAPYVNTGL